MGNTSSSNSREQRGGSNSNNNSAISIGTPPRSIRIRSGSAQQQVQSNQGQGGSSSSSSRPSASATTSGLEGSSNSTSTRRRAGTSSNSKDKETEEGPPPPPLFPQDARVDNGHLVPLSNIYPNATQEWVKDIVQSLIVERKLAPFYRGLEDYEGEDNFDKDEIDTALDLVGDERAKQWRTSTYSQADRKAEAAMYKEASECPICFLYYPPLINTSRCCDQPICTECFVQIKRADPTTTNMISEPAACPYCVEANFGVTYIPPPVNRRTGLGAPKSSAQVNASHQRPTDALSREESGGSSEIELGPAAAAHSRRKSLSHTAAEVVTVDAIQPDWEAKLAAVRATAARRAARRVVFRQIGERLVPVGISSGREINPNHLITDDQGRLILTTPIPVIGQGGAGSGGQGREASVSSMVEMGLISRESHASIGFSSPSRLLGRSSRRRGNTQGSHPTGEVDHRMLLGGDLEELMVMEAMRLSMLDEEERRKKDEKDAKAKAKKEAKESKHKRRPSSQAETTGESSSSAALVSSPLAGPSSNATDERSFAPAHRGSLDVARSSLDSARAVLSGKGKDRSSTLRNGGSDSPGSYSPNHVQPSSSSSSSSFLKMPPMQRNDSTASMSQHNLMPPMVPSKAEPGSAVHRETAKPETQRTYSDLLS